MNSLRFTRKLFNFVHRLLSSVTFHALYFDLRFTTFLLQPQGVISAEIKISPYQNSCRIKIEIKAFISSRLVTGPFELSKDKNNLNNLATVPFTRHNNCESTVVAHSKLKLHGHSFQFSMLVQKTFVTSFIQRW